MHLGAAASDLILEELVPLFEENEEVKIDLGQMLRRMKFPECLTQYGTEDQMETHFAIELVSDNEGRMKDQQEFSEIYRSHQQHLLIDKQAYDVHTATVMDWNDILYDMQS